LALFDSEIIDWKSKVKIVPMTSRDAEKSPLLHRHPAQYGICVPQPHPLPSIASFALNMPREALAKLVRDPNIVANVDEYCGQPPAIDSEILDRTSCGAGRTVCYITPQGDVTPCLTLPLKAGNLRQSSFAEIWRRSPQLEEFRSIRNRDLKVCSSCANLSICERCPALAFYEGDIRGASPLTCEVTFARTGILSPVLAIQTTKP
jgi:radical SAM protein with 4Fe4S-binding SPASM domain